MNSTKIKNFANSKLWIYILTFLVILLFDVFYNNTIISAKNEGDLGRDLYNFYLVSKGQWPYIDFNWIYGPLLPLLQGLNFKLFGVSYHNALILSYIILLISTYLTFFIVKSFSNRFFGFLAGLLFICIHGFSFHTFNHILGIPFILGIIYFLLRYLKEEKHKYLYFLALCCTFLATVKLNIALAYSVPIYLSLYIYTFKKKKSFKHVLYSNILIILLSLIAYCSLIAFAPLDQFGKWFPYNTSYLQTISMPLWEKLTSSDITNISNAYNNSNTFIILYYLTSLALWYFLIPLLIIIFILYTFVKDKNTINTNHVYMFILSITLLLSTHEYLKVGTIYSLRFWSIPTLIMLVFYTLNYSITTYSNKKYFKQLIVIFSVLVIIFTGAKYYLLLQYKDNHFIYCPYDRMKISLGGFAWYSTLNAVNNYVQKNLKPGEQMLSIPYSSIFNFVTKRDQPTRITEFYYLSQLTQKDQKEIIKTLENKHIRYILNSHKQGKIKGGVGIFGETHCKMLNNYIKQNYTLDMTFTFKLKTKYPSTPISIYKRTTPFSEEKL